jgi:E3 ubiquitin-protein ligase listerin
MPTIVGPWLAGLYDEDKTVAKAAQEAIKLVFPTEEKFRGIWKVFSGSILNYCKSAILEESVNSLSDERTTSPEDGDAKYARVVATSVAVITRQINNIDEKQEESLTELLNDAKLWGLCSHKDLTIRKSVSQLLVVLCDKKPEIVETATLEAISTSLIFKGMVIDQSGSAGDYISTVAAVTNQFPTIWTDHYTSKKSAIIRFRHLLQKGSQSAGPASASAFWTTVASLLTSNILLGLLPRDVAAVEEFLESVLQGVSKESRWSSNTAWIAYFHITTACTAQLTETTQQQQVASQYVLPVFKTYIKGNADDQKWSSVARDPSAAASAFIGLWSLNVGKPLVENEIQHTSSSIIDSMKLSLPEQSKDYDKSQDSLANEGTRWSKLQLAVLERTSLKEFEDGILVRALFSECSVAIIRAAIEVLKERKGKPYGAAKIINSIMLTTPQLVFDSDLGTETLCSFITTDLPSLIFSPSFSSLITVLCPPTAARENSQQYGFSLRMVWPEVVRQLVASMPDAKRDDRILALLQGARSVEIPTESEKELSKYVLGTLRDAIAGDDAKWPIVDAALKTSLLTAQTSSAILTELTDAISVPGTVSKALHGLEYVSQSHPDRLVEFAQHEPRLLSGLLFLADSPDEAIRARAEKFNHRISQQNGKAKKGGLTNDLMLPLIVKGLLETGTTSPSIDTLVERTLGIIKQTDDSERTTIMEALLPDLPTWVSALTPFLSLQPKQSLAITNRLGGAIFLVSDSPPPENTAVEYDQEGYSVLLRLATYSVGVLKSTNIFETLPPSVQGPTLVSLLLTADLANDNVTLAGANNIWSIYSADFEIEMVDFISDMRAITAKALSTQTTLPDAWPNIGITMLPEFSEQDSLILEIVKKQLERSASLTTEAFYRGQVASGAISDILEEAGHAWKSADAQLKQLNVRKNPNAFVSIAILTGFSTALYNSKEADRLRNELVSDLTGLDLIKRKDNGLKSLVLFNSLVASHEGDAPIAQERRLLLFVKQLVSQLNKTVLSTCPGGISEIAKILTTVLPTISGVYGEHWSTILDFINEIWVASVSPSPSYPFTDMETTIPVIFTSLKLYAAIRAIKDGNDDLEDGWRSAEGQLSKSLVGLLSLAQDVPDEFHQPLNLMNALIARQISKVNLVSITKPEDLYPLLNASSRPIQQAAFDLLHRTIPTAQEQISFDAALSKEEFGGVELPLELLSLVVSPPSLESMASVDFSRAMPLSLRSYLLSWLLVYDHFTNASYKVRSAYIDSIKKGDHLAPLLSFTFKLLFPPGRRAVDPQKFPNIDAYGPDMEDDAFRDTYRLLMHIYYLALKFTPSLAKSWFISLTNRALTTQVEAFTTKTISPLVIGEELANVSGWVTEVAVKGDEEEQKLVVKVSKNAREVSAAYEVDEQELRILVKLPEAYPLRSVEVQGIQRVAVDEKKWRSWLINTQGVITFSVS